MHRLHGLTFLVKWTNERTKKQQILCSHEDNTASYAGDAIVNFRIEMAIFIRFTLHVEKQINLR